MQIFSAEHFVPLPPRLDLHGRAGPRPARRASCWGWSTSSGPPRPSTPPWWPWSTPRRARRGAACGAGTSALDRLRTVGAGTGPARRAGLAVDAHGWVGRRAGMPPVDRVALPKSPAAGRTCGSRALRLERLPGGWLLRPGGHEQRVRLRLQLRDDPRAVVSQPDGGDPWVQPLTSRHTEILTLLAGAGPAGRRSEPQPGAVRLHRPRRRRQGRDVAAAPGARGSPAGPAVPVRAVRRPGARIG